ncbi:MAG: metallophosphoesterase [Candidatus Micrarchaeota archaeon]
MFYKQKNMFVVLLIILSIICLIVFVDSVFIEPYNLKITENTFNLFNQTGEPIKVVLISDIHIASQEKGYLTEVVNKINELEPDLILIAGDSIDYFESELQELEPLKKLNAPLGKFAALGNHDYGIWGCNNPIPKIDKQTEKRLNDLGISVLRNELEIIESNNKRFAVFGIDDAWLCKNNYSNALRNLDASTVKIVFTHNQVSFSTNDTDSKTLVLAGHTHCGQIQIPFLTDFLLEQSGFGKISGGRAKYGDGEIYVTCGVTTGKVRFLTNPEISVIYLK